MNCQDFESLLADAVGGELPAAQRPAFESHAASCHQCRGEFESLRRTLQDARSLTPARHVFVHRVGDQLVLSEKPVASKRTEYIWWRAPLRYAAAILIAFVAGYAAHASLIHGAARVDSGGSPGDAAATLQVALADIHARDPGRSDLAKGMIAVFDGGRR